MLTYKQTKNHNASIERCKAIIEDLENYLNQRVIAYFSSDIDNDVSSIINHENVFIIENLLSIPNDKKDLILVLHSSGGFAFLAEQIADKDGNIRVESA